MQPRSQDFLGLRGTQESLGNGVGTNVILLQQYYIHNNKRDVLRRQSRDTNRKIKRSVYCQYG